MGTDSQPAETICDHLTCSLLAHSPMLCGFVHPTSQRPNGVLWPLYSRHSPAAQQSFSISSSGLEHDPQFSTLSLGFPDHDPIRVRRPGSLRQKHSLPVRLKVDNREK